MRRMLIFAVFVGVGVLVLRTRGSKLHERLMARCEEMFEGMPDTFPPKRMMREVEEIRGDTARILDLLESRSEDVPGDEVAGVAPTPARPHAA